MQIFNNFLITTKWCDCGWIDWAAFVSKVIVLISSKKLNMTVVIVTDMRNKII